MCLCGVRVCACVLAHVFFSLMIFQVRGTGGSFGNGLSGFHVQPIYHGIKDVFMKVYTEGGVRALYRGVGMWLQAHSLHSTIFKMTIVGIYFLLHK